MGACSIIHIHHNLVFAIGRVASSLTFSLWVDVRNSLLKRPNQRSFAICNKERFGPACSNTKKNTIHYDL